MHLCKLLKKIFLYRWVFEVNSEQFFFIMTIYTIAKIIKIKQKKIHIYTSIVCMRVQKYLTQYKNNQSL